MSEMVERVAKALEADGPLYCYDGSVELDGRALARAAIAAMREPTEAMLVPTAAVLGRYIADSLGVSDRDAAIGIWEAMIDGALE